MAPPPPPSGADDLAAFVSASRRLLSLEREAEVAEVAAASSSSEALSALEACGVAVTRLSLVGRRSSAGGRVTLELSTRGGRVLCAPRLSTGDIVSVRAHVLPGGKGAAGRRRAAMGAGDGEEGVLSVMEDTRMEVVVDDDGAGGDGGGAGDAGSLYACIQVGSDVTFKRCTRALDELERAVSAASHPAFALCGVLFRGADPRCESDAKLVLTPGQRDDLAGLNESQRDAVRHALLSKELAVIHGPPGTGKTTAVTAYIAAEVRRGARVLVVAPSNVAVDCIAERLAALKRTVKFVRAGHPARVMESVAEHTLEARLAQTDDAELARDIRAELATLDGRFRDARSGERRAIRGEQRQLRKELRTRESDALRRLLMRVDCVLSTTTGAGGRMLHHATAAGPFDVVVVDEAGQATEASALIAILRGRKAVLAGDPFQLAPTVKCRAAEDGGLGRTLLDRVFSRPRLHEQATRMLVRQYRMHSVISNWSSDALYGGRLEAAPAVAGHLLTGLVESPTPVDDGPEDSIAALPWVLIDTAGCGFAESGEDDSNGRESRSRSNEGEAAIVVEQVKALVGAGVQGSAIGVISPYAGQVSLLRAKLRGTPGGHGVEVATVDSFQGREKEAILLSLVRSNDRGNVGFLADRRRLNVAITRARRHVCIVCDSSTVSTDPFLSAMVDYASEFGEYRAADPGMVTAAPRPSVPDAAAAAPPPPSTSFSAERPKAHGVSGKGTGSRGKRRPRKGASSAPAPPSSVELEEHRETADQVRAFALSAASNGDGPAGLAFDASLSAAQRRIVHAVAGELGLRHETKGEGSLRFISVSAASKSPLPHPAATAATDEAGGRGDDDGDDEGKGAGRFDPLLDEGGEDDDDSADGASAAVTAAPLGDTGDESTLASPPACMQTADEGARPQSLAPSEPGGTNDILRQAAEERRRRLAEQPAAAAAAAPRTPRRIDAGGFLLEGPRAREAAATAAARRRLNSMLTKQSEARRRQHPTKK
jgi:ATP-dependent RNA/DNA helicase IGHMBP2